MSTSSNSPAGIDPRGPRFGAGITAVLLLVTIALGLAQWPRGQPWVTVLLQPAFLLLAAITACSPGALLPESRDTPMAPCSRR
jgi:hypothetical protein